MRRLLITIEADVAHKVTDRMRAEAIEFLETTLGQ